MKQYKLAPHVTEQDLIEHCIVKLVCDDGICHTTLYDEYHGDIDLHFFFETRKIESYGIDDDIIKDLIDKGMVIEL